MAVSDRISTLIGKRRTSEGWPASGSLSRLGLPAFAKVTARSLQPPLCTSLQAKAGAGDEARTRDVHLGKEVLYQLSYTRNRVA